MTRPAWPEINFFLRTTRRNRKKNINTTPSRRSIAPGEADPFDDEKKNGIVVVVVVVVAVVLVVVGPSSPIELKIDAELESF